MGVCDLVERQTRHTDGYARQDRSGPSCASNDSKSPSDSTEPLGRRWKADRGLRMACSEQERTHGAVKPQETTRKSAEALESASLCPLQSQAHVSDSSWRLGM